MRQISSNSATVFDLSSHLPMGHHFRDAVAAIRQPFVVYDAEERLAAFNAAFSDLHREPDGTRVLHPGMSFQDVMEWRLRTGFFAPDPEGAGHLPAAEYRLARGDVVYRLRDGRWMFVDNYSLPDGRLACTWSDITAVKQAERQLWELSESLRQSQDHLVRAQRIAQVGSIERDLRTDNLRWTAEMYQIFGRDPRLPPPTRAENLKLFHPDDRARFAEELRASEEGRTTAPAEFRIVRPDGSIRWIHHESEVFYDDAGKPSLRIATYKDVTEIHEYREQERALQAELLSSERFSAIGQVAATVTHELRNPLSTIKNTLYLVKEAAAANRLPGERLFDRIERSIDRCNRIIGDLLEYSRTGPVRCRPHDFDSWLTELVADPLTPPGAPICLDLSAPGIAVALDPGRFRRALANLLDNATQALLDPAPTDRTPQITLRTRHDEDMVEFAIEDNGLGMPAGVLARAFEPLFSTKMFGTGLGLPIVKQIVEQHGGSIELDSTPGEGTRACLRLPVRRQPAAERARVPRMRVESA